MPVPQLEDLPFAHEESEPPAIASLVRPRREILSLDDLPFEQDEDLPSTATQEAPRRFDLPDFPKIADEPLKPIEPVRFAPRQQPQKQEKPKGPEFKGFILKNFLDDSFDVVKSIAEMAFVGLPKGVMQLATKPEEHWQDIKQTWSKEGVEQLWDATVGRYVKAVREGGLVGLVAELHNHPGLAAMDLAALAGGVGLATRATGAATKMVGAVRAGQALSKAGYAIGRTGQAIDPFVAMTKLAGKVAKPILEYRGFGEHTTPILALRDTEYSAEMIRKTNALRRIVSNGLTDDEARLLDNAVSVGSPEDLAALKGTRAEAAYGVWREISKGTQEATLKERPGVLSQRRADVANAKRAAIYLSERTGKTVTVKEALALMREGKIDPTFASMLRESKASNALMNAFFQDVKEAAFGGTARKVARLEKRLGDSKFIRDPREYMVRQTAMFHDVNWRLRWMDRVMGYLKGKGLLRAVKSSADVPPGYEVIPETMYRKYYDTAARAGSVLVDDIQRQIRATGQADINKAAQTALNTMTTTKGAKEIGGMTHIAVPRHVARLIASEFKLPGPWGRLYDRTMGYWKAAATIYSPRYWIPVAISNGFLGVLAGIGFEDFANFLRHRQNLPASLRASSEIGLQLPGMNAYEKFSRALGEAAQALDRNQLRGPLFAKSVRETFQELKATGNSFFPAATALDDFMKTVSASTDELSRIERRIQILQEQAAAAIPEYQAARKSLAAVMTPIKIIKGHLKRLGRGPSKATAGTLARLNRDAAAWQMKIFRIKEGVLQRLRESGELYRQIPELQKYAEVAERAIELGNRFAGNYNRLHPVSRHQIRRWVPFFNFTKAMLVLAARLPYLHPVRTFMWHRLSKMVNDAITDDEQPEWVQRFVPVAAAEDGSVWAVNMMSANPWQGATKTGSLGESPIPSIADIGRQNPLVKLFLDVSGATPSWSKRPVSVGENATRLDNGAAIKFERDENGRIALRKTVPQVPWGRALWNLFPQGQLADQIFLGDAQTDRGYLLDPDPMLDAKGQPIGHKDLKERLASIFVRAQKINIPEEKKKEKSRIYGVIRSLQDDIRRAPPQDRAAMMEILKDWWRDAEHRWNAIQD